MVRGRRGRRNARWPVPVLGGAGVVSVVIVAVIGIGQVTGGRACASTVPAGAGPFRVRLTDTAGHQVTVRGIRLDPGVIQATGTRMYGTGTETAPMSVTSGPASAGSGPVSRSPVRRQRVLKPAAADSATAAPASRVPRRAPVTSARAPRSPSATSSCLGQAGSH